ncbi:unnamed protein product [Aphanomyces euteiches]
MAQKSQETRRCIGPALIIIVLDMTWTMRFQVLVSSVELHFVQPRECVEPTLPTLRTRLTGILNSALLQDWTGWLYALASACLGIYGCWLMSLYHENDLFWPRFRELDTQNALIAIWNSKLELTMYADPFEILDPLLALPRSIHGTISNSISFNYPRTLLYSQLTDAKTAIASLRTLEVPDVTYTLNSQYCWVDFNKTWELGHTVARQARCQALYFENAAMYLEAVLRNIDFHAWIESYDDVFTNAVGNDLMETPEGTQWLQYIHGHEWREIQVEAAVWAQFNLTVFAQQWANHYQMGIKETITLKNALGQEHPLQIKLIAPQERGTMWTSSNLYAEFENDLWAMATNQSLVRQSVNFFAWTNPTTIEAYVVPFPLNTLNQVTHDELGEMGSIDLIWLQPPKSLMDGLRWFRRQVIHALETNPRFAATFESIKPLAFHPSLTQWRDRPLVFYGSNPMCSSGMPLPFIQNAFGFDDSCAVQMPFVVTMSAFNALFAASILNMSGISAACDAAQLVAPDSVDGCKVQMKSLALALGDLPVLPFVAAIRSDIESMRLGAIQYVGNGSSISIQEQLLVDDKEPAWTACSWMALYDWGMGQREAVSFQGDKATFNVLSSVQHSYEGSPNPSDVRTSIGLGFLSAVVLVSSVMCCVLLLATFIWIQRRAHVGVNWFMVNRVAGMIWIGRPLLCLRGVAAILCLSTAPIHPSTTANNVLQLSSSPRSVFESTVLAGDALWLAYVFIDLLYPFTRNHAAVCAMVLCHPLDLFIRSRHLVSPGDYCDAGSAMLDALLICIVQAAVVSLFALFASRRRKLANAARQTPSMLLSGTAVSFLGSRDNAIGLSSLDDVSSVFSGLVVFEFRAKRYVFDVTLWLVFDYDTYVCRDEIDRTLTSGSMTNSFKLFRIFPLPPTQLIKAQSRLTAQSSPHRRRSSTTLELAGFVLIEARWYARLASVFLGFAVVLSSLVGSYFYMFITTAQAMANDFYWADFNSTGTHAYLANVLNKHLMLNRSQSIALDDAAIADIQSDYSSMDNSILFSDSSARRVMSNEMTALPIAIANLRRMDPCKMPWMFTQYCWVDFAKEWEMANSKRRQERCRVDMDNGAVYLDSVLRNTRSWSELESCWGDSLDVAIFQALRETKEGTAWLAQVRSVSTSVAAESAHWSSHGLTRFALQWQNYKLLGISDEMQIQNALGTRNPLTLSFIEPTYRLEHETSRKMYWSLASDLSEIESNLTMISKGSLIRSSGHFAFENVAMEQVLMENLTLANPLTPGFAAFQATIGPFGSVDMKYISCPAQMKSIYQALLRQLLALLYSNLEAQRAFLSLPRKSYISPFPSDWLVGNIATNGGNILVSSVCSNYFMEYLKPDEFMLVFGLLGLRAMERLSTDDIAQLCSWDVDREINCVDIYAASIEFLGNYSHLVSPLEGPAREAYIDAIALNITTIQFIMNETTPELYQRQLLTLEDSAWMFYGWCYMYDWVVGNREVVSFQGDVSTVTTISSYKEKMSLKPDPSEIPRDFSYLVQFSIKFVTALSIGLGSWIAVYTLIERGQIEGYNLFRLNRLVGLVWTGRLFIFIRSISAVILLSTLKVSMVKRGTATAFTLPRLAWYDMILASLELHWFIYLLNDALSCFTRLRTAWYASKCTWLTSALVLLWMACRSNQLTAQINRQCIAKDMDYALVCNSGVVEIGNMTFLLFSVAICFFSVLTIMAFDKYVWKSKQTIDCRSLLLSAPAKYILDFEHWVYDNVFYVDRATALMTGIISIVWRDKFYLLDIKKWRILVISRPTLSASAPRRFHFAVPIYE